jgi:hypothetical protein
MAGPGQAVARVLRDAKRRREEPRNTTTSRSRSGPSLSDETVSKRPVVHDLADWQGGPRVQLDEIQSSRRGHAQGFAGLDHAELRTVRGDQSNALRRDRLADSNDSLVPSFFVTIHVAHLVGPTILPFNGGRTRGSRSTTHRGFFQGALLKDPKKVLVQLGQVQAGRVMKKR